jgi:glycosyltransferase involved in cell wall biosynthesis
MLYPGSLHHHQGLDVAIRAFAKAATQMPTAQFCIYGQGQQKESLQLLAREQGMEGRVVFHEPVPLESIAEIMSHADLAIVPKRASCPFGTEAASTKILQFMALGVPLVVSRTKIDTLLFSEDQVEFFESENESDLADRLVSLYREADRRSYLSTNGSLFGAENSWTKKKTAYLELVAYLVGEHEKAPQCRR